MAKSNSADEFTPGTRVRLRQFSRSLPMLLLRAREAVMRHFRAGLRENGITEQQWRVLRALSSVYEIEITVLAHATFLLAPSLSRILKDLEARELIKRRIDDNDMRRSFISIAPQGIALIDSLSGRSEAIYSEISNRFGKDKFDLLQDLLRDLETALEGDWSDFIEDGEPEAAGRQPSE